MPTWASDAIRHVEGNSRSIAAYFRQLADEIPQPAWAGLSTDKPLIEAFDLDDELLDSLLEDLGAAVAHLR